MEPMHDKEIWPTEVGHAGVRYKKKLTSWQAPWLLALWPQRGLWLLPVLWRLLQVLHPLQLPELLLLFLPGAVHV